MNATDECGWEILLLLSLLFLLLLYLLPQLEGTYTVVVFGPTNALQQPRSRPSEIFYRLISWAFFKGEDS